MTKVRVERKKPFASYSLETAEEPSDFLTAMLLFCLLIKQGLLEGRRRKYSSSFTHVSVTLKSQYWFNPRC